VEHITIAFACK